MKWLKYFVVVVFGVLLVACGTKQAEPKVQKAIDVAFEKNNGSKNETELYYAFKDETSVVVYEDELYYYVLGKQPQSEKANDAFEFMVRIKKSDYSDTERTWDEDDIMYVINQSSVKEIYRDEKGN